MCAVVWQQSCRIELCANNIILINFLGVGMNQKKIALVSGITMLVIGILAFYPGLNRSADELSALNVEASYGVFLNIFPMNILNKLVFIFLGIAGIAVSGKERTTIPAIIFMRWVFWLMSGLTVLGLFRPTNTLFGYWPLYGNDVLIHAVFALVTGYYGYNRAARTTVESKIVAEKKAA